MSATRLPHAELVRMLSASLGEEKAHDAVLAAARSLRLSPTDYDRDQTLRLLDALAATPGIVGTVARFAKARVILRFED